MNSQTIQPIDLHKRTVFVLGAGASKPYGFPLGNELRVHMVANLNVQPCKDILTRNGFEKALVDDFGEAIAGTYHPTIDIFLEKKRKFRALGAYLIAYVLLPCENHNMLFPQKDWYAHLYGGLNFERESPDTSNITFVTLNYDRSLEHFLTRNINYNCSDTAIEIATQKLHNLTIIHAHGSLGLYPSVPFGHNRDYKDVLRCAAEGISIASDNLEDSIDFKNARKAISEADNIVFIGFGYDSVTLRLLLPWLADSSLSGVGSHHQDLSNKRIIGTVYNLPQTDIDRIAGFFHKKFEYIDNTATANHLIYRILPLS